MKKAFLIETVAIFAIVFLYVFFNRYPLFDWNMPGLYEGIGYALGFLLPCWAILRLMEDAKVDSAHKWTRFLIRILVIYAAFGLSSACLRFFNF